MTQQTECCEKCDSRKARNGEIYKPHCISPNCPCHKSVTELVHEAFSNKSVHTPKETDSVEAIVEEFEDVASVMCDSLDNGAKWYEAFPVASDWLREKLTSLRTQNQRKIEEAVEAERKNMYKMPDGSKPDIVFIGMYKDGQYYQEALTP